MKFVLLVAAITCAFTSVANAPPAALSHAGLAGLNHAHVNPPTRLFKPVGFSPKSARPAWARDFHEFSAIQPLVGQNDDSPKIANKYDQIFKDFLAAEEAAAKPAPKKGLAEKAKDFVADGKRRDRRARQNLRNKVGDALDNIGETLDNIGGALRPREGVLVPVPIPVPVEVPGHNQRFPGNTGRDQLWK